MRKFELTEELLENIVWAMENFEAEHALDAEKGRIISIDEDSEDLLELEEEGFASFAKAFEAGRLVKLPEWDSSRGFQLMEEFVGGLKNPPAKEALRQALGRGRGVFRAFKDAIKGHPEVERLWRAFKDDAMRRVVRLWYEGLAEGWKAEKLGDEPEEIEELILSDLNVRSLPVRELDRELLREAVEDSLASFPEALRPLLVTGRAGVVSDSLCAVLAEAPSGDVAGLASIRFASTGSRADGLIELLYVRPRWRGLGLGELLLERATDEGRKAGLASLSLMLPSRDAGFERAIIRAGGEEAARLFKICL